MLEISAIDYLRSLKAQAESNGVSLPDDNSHLGLWTGIGFHLQEHPLIVGLHSVIEILDPMDSVQVPNVKPWFKGLANVRGNLLPLVDLQHFFFGKKTAITTQTRVIVFADEGVNIGCLVNSVIGMRYFQNDMRSIASDSLPSELAPFVAQGFKSNEEHWDEFNIDQLINMNDFVQIAA